MLLISLELGELKILALHPEGWAAFPQDNAHSAQNALLEVVDSSCGRASAGQVKFKEISFCFGSGLKFGIWSAQLVK